MKKFIEQEIKLPQNKIIDSELMFVDRLTRILLMQIEMEKKNDQSKKTKQSEN